MREEEFLENGIVSFTPREIIKSGSNLKDIKLETMIRAQKYRSLIGRRVKIPINGMASGSHKSPWHPLGLALDSYLDSRDGPVKPLFIFKAALEAGFKAIGIYYNGKVYSFHFDLRPKYAFWCGYKQFGEPRWTYQRLIVDPADYLK